MFATRERTTLLNNLINSINSTVKNQDLIEVIAIYDDDDKETDEFANSISCPYLRMIKQPRTKRLNEDYINSASRLSSGKYILVLNDDVEFITPGWDEIILSTLDSFTDGIIYGNIDDGMNDLKSNQKLQYCGFPVLGKKGTEILNYSMSPIFNSWGADVHLYRVYNAIGRVIEVPIKILHISSHIGLRERDNVNINSELINNCIDPMKVDITSDVNKLKKALGQQIDIPVPISQRIDPLYRRLEALKRRK